MFIHFLETKNLLRFVYFLLITWFHRLQVIEQLIRSFNVVNFSKICSNISTNIISMLQKSNKISFIGQIIKNMLLIPLFKMFCNFYLLLIIFVEFAINQNKTNVKVSWQSSDLHQQLVVLRQCHDTEIIPHRLPISN